MPDDPLSGVQLPPPLGRTLMRFAFHTAFSMCGGLVVRGVENIPMNGPVIFCPNHLSDCDPAVFYSAMPRADVNYMGKEELFDKPFQNWLFRLFGGFPVKRDSADRTALRTAAAVLGAGRGLIIFPEGRISKDRMLHPLLDGAALIAIKAGAPIVPIGIRNTYKVLPYGDLWPKRSPVPVKITFGRPIQVSDYADLRRRAATDAVMARLKADLLDLSGLPEAPR